MISGYVEKIVYKNEDNAYCVLEVSSEGESIVLVGTFPFIEEGSFIEAEGVMRFHPSYGEQMQVSSYKITRPDDARSIEKYLASGAIRGIGAALASRIVKRFGEDTIRIMEEEPERLAEIKGISMRIAMEISSQVEEKRDMRDAMMFLTGYGIGMNLALKIYRSYGNQMYSIVKENPYRIAEDLGGVGFKAADDIARKVGVSADSTYRIKAGILYMLGEGLADGHTCLPDQQLISDTAAMLEVPEERVEELLYDLQMERRLFIRKVPDGHMVYDAVAYYTELNTAAMLHDISEAVPVEVITGGPGTGKTTNIKRIIEECEKTGLRCALAAPTGRAAKRMQEATGCEAKTIHRLLEVSGKPEETDGTRIPGIRFDRNEENPLEEDVVIIDEMSMVDIFLMHALLCAIVPGTKLVLVGDVNQLPSVGPGNVLKDIIDSDCFQVMKLTTIYRQAAESDIVLNAHRIIDGEEIDLNKKSRDFLFIRRNDPDAIINAMLTLIMEKLPAYVHASSGDIQILTPMRKGPLGVERLNTIFRQFLNPPEQGKTEKELSGTLWREGDKVMQIRNNYDAGVYNGDTGFIEEINLFAEYVIVRFDDSKDVEYPFTEMDQLELAYAVTVHKSQGSEYPAVIIPMFQGPSLLMNRNLLYTAVTRARSCAVMVGVPEAFWHMAANNREMSRFSGLKDRIKEIYDIRSEE